MSTVIAYTPRKLIAVRERVLETHPGTASAPPAPDPTAFDAIRRGILAARESAHSLDQFADSLSPKEVRAVVGGLERWEDLRGECGHILRRRATARLLPLLWAAWQRHPTVEAVRSLLLSLGAEFGWSRAVAPAYVNAAPDWVQDQGPALQRWLDAEGLNASDVESLADRPIVPGSPLARIAIEGVMVRGSLRQLRADHGRFPEWQEQMAPETAILFFRHYLVTMPDDDWAESLIQIVHGRYGPPKRPRVERFWAPIPESVKAAFQRRYIRERIKQELGHDDDRERFWTRWAEEIVDLTKGFAGRTRYAEIEFEDFVVFEFFETGNAAYFYTPEDARKMKVGRAYAPSDLKQIINYPFLRWSENRLIHAPRGGWWAKADRLIKLWIKGAGRRGD